MKAQFFIGLLAMSVLSLKAVKFTGLTEDPSINKNSFLCSSSLQAEGIDDCQDRVAQAVNFEFNGPRTLQLFNNQQFWVQKKYQERQLLMARSYQGNDLDSRLKELGWNITGGFLIVITTDPLITNQVETSIVPSQGEVKIVAQLWYNGGNLIQLWAQDVALIKNNESFSIFLSNSESALSESQKAQSSGVTSNQKLNNSKSLQAIKQQFLSEIQLSPKNIISSDYDVAFGSPKNIKIIPTE